MNRIKIAQIGVGHDHSDLITSLMRQNDIFDVKGFCVCDGEDAHYELVRDQFFSGATRVTLDDILNDPELDAVAIETTEANLTKYARLALERGLHVHMDKPGSADHAAFTEMVRLADERLAFGRKASMDGLVPRRNAVFPRLPFDRSDRAASGHPKRDHPLQQRNRF